MCVSALVKFIPSCTHLYPGAPQYTVSAPTYVIQGNTLTVHCNVTSFPQSSVSLSLDVTPIVTSVSEYYDTRAGLFNYFTTYSTLAVHPSDEGYYACLANITHGHPAVAEVFDYSVFIAIYGESCSHTHTALLAHRRYQG